ncbi:putative RNA-directed DNA polymerase [Tanacetum coccineum]
MRWKKGWVKSIIRDERPDVTGLQETKSGTVDEYWIEELWGGMGFEFTQIEANGSSGGILLIWDTNTFTCKEAMGDERFISIKGEWKGRVGDVFLVCVHRPHIGRQKASLWDRLMGLMNKYNGAWCIFGDLNVVRSRDDRLNSQVNVKEMNEFNDFINDARLVEVPMGGRKFTRISDDGMKFSKLDRFLLNDGFNNLRDNLSVVALDRKLSDHCPIVLKDMDINFSPRPFRVFDIWLDEIDIGQVVEKAWRKEVSGNKPDCRFCDKLKNVKQELKRWSNERFGATKEKIELFKNEAMKWELEAENRVLNDIERSVWLDARKQWVDKENEYASMLRQKAKIRWDVEGDENSKFFHSYVKRRNNKNNIRGLMVNGMWCEIPPIIKAEMARHYKELFSERTTIRPIFCCERIEKISMEEAIMLEGEFNEKEVWDAIQGCGSDKAPGPDGFNFKFIRKFWEVLKPELMVAVKWFWDRSEISRGCNASFVTIIPKVADPIGLGDFRPISLIGCYYKIVAKLLAERVKKVVGKVVGDVQNAFIKGRFIFDGILIANETVDYLKGKKKKGLIFKVDFEKAYDSINWRFLIDIMKKMGFGAKWCKWVESFLSSSTMSILVNGSPKKEFNLERGVGQGDPLSPFLFILAAEGLNAIINEAAKKGIFSGISIGNNRVCFEEVSGLRINYNRSKLYGVGVNDREIGEMARWMRCRVADFPFTYLGLPIGENMRRVGAWNPVVDKFKKRLSEWKAKTMSFGGRLTLVKSVLGSLPLYYFLMLRVPSSVLKNLERIRKIFFWGGAGERKKLSWVKWDMLLVAHGVGGLNIGIHGESGRLGGVRGVEGDVNIRGEGRQIVKIGEELEGVDIDFAMSFKGVVGDGRDIGFWLDRWIGGVRLCDRFPRLYHLDRRKESRVADQGKWVNNEWCWEWEWVREPRGRVEDGEFMVKGLSKMVEEKTLRIENSGQETLWNKCVPKKVNIFVWRALKGRLPVREELDKRGVDLDSILCPCCDSAVESCNHSLVMCNFARSVWEKIFIWWKIGGVNAFSIREIFSSNGNVVTSNLSVSLWQAVLWTSGYFIWKARNMRVFSGKVSAAAFSLMQAVHFSCSVQL